MRSNGRIILLNGTSSAGKSTLARALRSKLEPQFFYYSSDQLAEAGFRPLDATARLASRKMFFEGFHQSIPVFAGAGIDLLVEHIVEEQDWADDLARLLSPFDTFWVGVHAPVAELERRERLRGDRQSGEANYHLKTHSFCKYDVEVDSMQPLSQNVDAIVNAWSTRLMREEQEQRAKLKAFSAAIDEGDASRVAGGDPFERVLDRLQHERRLR